MTATDDADKSTDTQRRRPRGEAVEGEPRHRVVAGAVLTGGMAAALAAALVHLPREHAALPQAARQALEVALPGWKLLEPVNEVVYGTRGFDTFGETFLLLAAVISVVVLARPREARRGYFGEDVAGLREQSRIDPHEAADAGEREARAAEKAEADEDAGRHARPEFPDGERIGTPVPERAEAMSVVVRGAVRAATPILAVTGCYLVAWGYSPGGGFPGGAVALGVVLLVYAAYGRGRIQAVVRPGLLETVEMAGAALIVLTEALGLVLNGSFTANWLPLEPAGTIRSGGVAQLFSAGELVEVGTGLTIAVFALLAMSHDWSPDADENENGNENEDAEERAEARRR
jgi:multicomponent Na+:H+ antiporter subunit B